MTAGNYPIDYDKYISFAGIVDLLKQFTPVINPADAEHPITFLGIATMLLPGSTATRDEFLENLSLLTGYEKADLDAIDAHLFPVFSFNNYRNILTWRRVIDCAEDLRKLGSSAGTGKRIY